MLCEERADLRKSIGLVLVFVGMQLNTSIKNVIPGLDIVELIMAASVALIIDYKGLFKIKPTLPMILLVAIQFVLLIYAVLSPKGTKQLITFHLYLIALTYAFATNTKHVEFKEFGRILFWVTGFITLVSFFYSMQVIILHMIEQTFLMRNMWLPQGGDPITMPRAIEISLISCMLYKKRNIYEKCACALFVFANIVNCVTYANRASIGGCVLCFFVWYFVAKDPFTIKGFLKKLAALAAVLLVCMIILSQIPVLYARMTWFIDFTINGIKTIFHMPTGNEHSAQIRNNLMAEVWHDFSDGIVLNVLRGYGYDRIYVHKPIIQIFVDTGIVGFLVYAYLLIVIPVIYLFKNRRFDNFDNQAEKYVIFFFIQNFIDQVLVGKPYHYFMWTPALFVIFTMANRKRRENNLKLKD